MSKTVNIFERLAHVQKESNKMESLKQEHEKFKQESEQHFSKVNELNQKVSMVQDVMNGKAKQEDVQAINLKIHNQIEELKKQLNVSEEVKKSSEEMKKNFVDIDEYNFKVCLEKYVLSNDPQKQEKCDALERRLKLIEQQQLQTSVKK
jgi:uncharacterized protein YukE